jgi:tape measure domain-containing protein
MAKTVQPIAIELGIKGGEKLAALNRSFRDLSKQVKLSDADITQATKDVIAFAEGAGRSVATIKAQAKALQGLQDQAKIGGKVYKQLGDDIRLLKTEIDSLEGAAKETGRAFRAMNVPSKVPEKFAENIRARRQELQGFAADSQEYLNALIGIANFERQQSVREQRAGVSAAARAAQIGLSRPVADMYLPDTLAGLKQRANELDFEIQNLTIGSDEYIRANRELTDVQEQLNFVVNGSTRAFEELDRAQSGAERRAKKLANIQSYYGEKAGAGVSGYRDPRTGAIIAPPASGSARVSLVQQPVREISGLYQSIGDVGMQKISADIEMMGNSYQEVAQDIRNATKASNNSIASLNSQRNSWVRLRDQLDPTSKDFREVTREIERVDKALEKTSRRRRMSAGQLAQAAGATISGGIFGGPEGFLGGAIGTAFGGPGGAFAGAAIGAQVGQFRQQIGQYSEMAAEVDRLRLGLAGASNDFQDFVAAVQATEGASKRLLIPLSDSYRIMTQLKANTVELGISTEDTRKIFEGITASIYKTGGGLAEVEGAMRAVIQVLSKGAPQAEEIRGQLGERLPAAIVDFARFTKRTPEELADAFQKSEVTLDEFVDFAKNKFDENGQYLDELAGNAAYAGLRYEKAIERIQLTTGRAFQATGSKLQDFAAKWINRIDAIINKAQEIGFIEKGPSFYVEKVLSGGMTIEELEDEVLRLSLVAKKAREANFNSGVVQNTKRDADAAEQALIRLRANEKLTKERKEQLKAQEAQSKLENQSKSFLSAVEQRENAIAQARIQLEERAAQIREQAVQRAKQLEEGFAKQRLNNERQIQDLRLQLSYVEEDIAFGAAEARAIAGGADPATFRVRKEIIDLARQQKEKEISLERQLLDEQTENTKAIEQFKIDNAKAINQANEDYAKQIGNIQQQYARSVAKIVEEGTGRAGKRLEISGKIVAEFIKQGQASATLSQYGVYMDDAGTPRMLPGTVLDTQAFEAVQSQVNLYDLAAKKIKEYTKELTNLPTAAAITAPAIDSIGVNISDLTARLNANKSALEATRQQIRGLSKDLSDAERIEKINAILREQAAPVSGALMGAQTQLAEQRGVLRLRQEGYSESTARQLFAQETAAAIALGNLEVARQEANRQGIPVDEVEYAKIAEGIRKATEETRALTLALENLSTGDKLRTGIIELRDELKTLVDPANQIKGAANAIGTAFTDSFMSAITGSATAQEALANFFSNTAKYFLDMAAQIIQKMITMAILNQVVGLLPGGNVGGGGGGGGDIFADIAARGGLRMKNGGAFDKGGLVPFAMGGIVDKPTMFAYANGGVGRFGLMGEAGPEAILPLQRGPGGRLGVQASGGSVGDVVVNVDASGTRAQGDNQSASQLGNVIGAAVQAELIKQKRPGGLLA